MKHSIVQGIGLFNILIGISGTAGAIEHDTGLVQSVALMITGSALVLADRYIRLRQQDRCAEDWENDRQ